MPTVHLPTAQRGVEAYRIGPASPYVATASGDIPRLAYAAAHVVADPMVDVAPWQTVAVDWDATLAYRRHLWGLGFEIAEAMDTSQRGMGLDWPTAHELIRRSLAEARTIDGRGPRLRRRHRPAAAGVGATLDDVRRAYEEQLASVEAAGGRAILMASRALAALPAGRRLSRGLWRPDPQATEPVILHWLGDMFDPELAGYWGSADVDAGDRDRADLISEHAARSTASRSRCSSGAARSRCAAGCRRGCMMYTGDDFNYAELIGGDAQGHSHALLGIFDAIAPAAAAALQALDGGDRERYRAILAPTVPLSRQIFEAPTHYYKAGVVFLAWLNGHQEHFAMVGGMQSARSALHYADILRLADRAALLRDPELAAARMTHLMALHGIG